MIKFIASLKLAIVLLSIIAAVSIIGTLIPQGGESADYFRYYGEKTAGLILKLDLDHVYHSGWFLTLPGFLIINLLVCTIRRLKCKLRIVSSSLMHLSVIVIVAGAITGALYGEKGYIEIREGESIDYFKSNNRTHQLDFELKLEDFILERYDTLTVSSADKEEVYPVIVGKEYSVADGNQNVKVIRYVPDFVMDIGSKTVSSRSQSPNNPAIQVEITDSQGKKYQRWLLARHPEMHSRHDKHFPDLTYKFIPPGVKDFMSELKIIEGGQTVLTKTIEVNHPLVYKGYAFYQSSYDSIDESWSGLQVTKDPGVPIVYAGFILLCGSLMFSFYFKPFLFRKNKEKGK